MQKKKIPGLIFQWNNYLFFFFKMKYAFFSEKGFMKLTQQ